MTSPALSLHPATVGWRVGWPGLAELAADAGYQGAVMPRDVPGPEEGMSDVPVPATAIQLPVEVRQDDETFASTFPRLQNACKVAAQAGCKVALLGIPPSSEQPRDAQATVYRERLKRCCAILDEYAIRLALECITPLHNRRAHPYEFIWHDAEMLEFGLSVSPNTGLVMDSWHWHHAGSDPQSIRGVPRDRILDVHLSDSPEAPPEEIRDSERLLPGKGIIDFELFFQLLDEKRYTGAVAVEIFGSRLAGMTPGEAARTAFDASQTMLAGMGRSGAVSVNQNPVRTTASG
ncbi:MAG: sugar phosphate isomerase/epimerase [Bryobacterales bacterium]|nr:sugar phosphate isomerase/epimerase [Bryobacterales bacterium]